MPLVSSFVNSLRQFVHERVEPCGVRAVHPHACGDNFLAFYFAFSSAGSPPRVWGQLQSQQPGFQCDPRCRQVLKDVGPHEIHLNTARAVEGYFQRHYPNTAMANLLTSAPTTSTLILMLLSTDGNIRYSAAYLRELADDRKGSQAPHLNDLTLTDKQIIYGAYRNGERSYGQISDFRGAQIPGVSGQKARFALILYGNYYR
jgi:hypothetical protein